MNTSNEQLSMSEQEVISYYGALFATGFADSSFGENELSFIRSILKYERITEEGKAKILSFEKSPPNLEECLNQLMAVDEVFKVSLLFSMVDIAQVDGEFHNSESEAIALAQSKLALHDEKVRVISEFVVKLKQIGAETDQLRKSANEATIQQLVEPLRLAGISVLTVLYHDLVVNTIYDNRKDAVSQVSPHTITVEVDEPFVTDNQCQSPEDYSGQKHFPIEQDTETGPCMKQQNDGSENRDTCNHVFYRDLSYVPPLGAVAQVVEQAERVEGLGAVAAGAAAGAGAAGVIGGIGVAAAGGAVGIGMAPVAVAGAAVGGAVYGAKKAIETQDPTALVAAGAGAAAGAGFWALVGNIGLAAAGGAVGVGMAPLLAAGAVVGLAGYGAKKILDGK